MPTYGPRYIDLYDQPENSRVRKMTEDMFEDEHSFGENSSISSNKEKNHVTFYSPVSGNGAFYVARLLLKIESKKVIHSKKSTVETTNGNPTSTSQTATIRQESQNVPIPVEIIKTNEEIKEFVAFAIISEVTMIDSRYSNGEISFQLCLGNYSKNKKWVHF